MPFYQNPFDHDFRGNWILDDRQLSLTFKCPASRNRNDLALAWNFEPYDFSTYNTLTIWYSFDRDFKNWAALAISVAGATPSATLAAEVVVALQANNIFTDYFTVQLDNNIRGTNQPQMRPIIKSVKPKHAFKFYIDNGGAESKLKFNKYAGLALLPSYFDRHTIANRFNYDDGFGMLVRLSQAITSISIANPTVITTTQAHGLTTGDTVYITGANSTPGVNGQRTATVTGSTTFTVPINVTVAGDRGEFLTAINYGVVTDYGLDYLSNYKQDWEQLSGGSSTFMFTNQTIDGSNRVTQKIEYHAGSVAGDLALKIVNVYSGTNTNPDKVFQIPYQLQSSDLITPP